MNAKERLNTPRDQRSAGCSFVDYDRDAKVDPFVARYVDFSYDSVPRPGQGLFCQWKGITVMCGLAAWKRRSMPCITTMARTFMEVSEKSGITHATGCYDFTSIAGDFNNDCLC